MNDRGKTFTIEDGYDKTKHPRLLTVRNFTLEDIRGLAASSQHEVLFIDRECNARKCRTNGRLKTWKRDPLRFEQSFTYGMYEHFRLTTHEMLKMLIVEVE